MTLPFTRKNLRATKWRSSKLAQSSWFPRLWSRPAHWEGICQDFGKGLFFIAEKSRKGVFISRLLLFSDWEGEDDLVQLQTGTGGICQWSFRHPQVLLQLSPVGREQMLTDRHIWTYLIIFDQVKEESSCKHWEQRLSWGESRSVTVSDNARACYGNQTVRSGTYLSNNLKPAAAQSVHLQQLQLKNNRSGNESISDIWLRAQAFEFWSEIVWQWHGADIFSFRPNAKHFTLNSAQICNKNYII